MHLTENCRLQCKLLPGDVVLEDHGFTMEQATGMYCDEVKYPYSLKGRNN